MLRLHLLFFGASVWALVFCCALDLSAMGSAVLEPSLALDAWRGSAGRDSKLESKRCLRNGHLSCWREGRCLRNRVQMPCMLHVLRWASQVNQGGSFACCEWMSESGKSCLRIGWEVSCSEPAKGLGIPSWPCICVVFRSVLWERGMSAMFRSQKPSFPNGKTECPNIMFRTSTLLSKSRLDLFFWLVLLNVWFWFSA